MDTAAAFESGFSDGYSGQEPEYWRLPPNLVSSYRKGYRSGDSLRKSQEEKRLFRSGNKLLIRTYISNPELLLELLTCESQELLEACEHILANVESPA